MTRRRNFVENSLRAVKILVCCVALHCHRSQAEVEPIILGGIFDLTSPAGSIWGNDERDGFILAVEEFRQTHPDASVTYAVEDSAYSNARSVSALQRLINVEKAKFVVGPTWETFVATSPICERSKIVCFAPSNFSNIFHDAKRPLKYSFTAFFDERGYGSYLAEKINSKKIKNFVVLSTISSYFETVSEAFLKSVNDKPLMVERFEPEVKDFKSLIGRVPKQVEALILFLDGTGQNDLFLSQWKQVRNDKPLLFSHDGILYEPNFEGIKKLGFTIYVSKPYLAPAVEAEWSKKMSARFGRKAASPSGSIAYDETMILLNCIYSKGDDADQVRECIATLKEYPGASGKLSFDGGQAVTTRGFTVEEIAK